MDNIDSGEKATIEDRRHGSYDRAFLWRGPESKRREHCRVAECPVQSGGQAWTFEVRVFNDGAAYRCRIPGVGKRHINGESATFALPVGAICYVNPNPVPYEGVHVRVAVEAIIGCLLEEVLVAN